MNGYIKAGSLLLLSIPLLWWALHDVALEDTFAVLLRLSPLGLIILSFVNVVILLLFTWRWWLVMLALGYKLPFPSLVIYRLAGFGVSYFTPGPQFGGEPLQVHLLHKHHNLPAASALAGVTLDKIVDMLVNFSFLAFGLLLVLTTRLFSFSELALLIPAGLLALPVMYLYLLRLGRRPVSWLQVRFFIPAKWRPALYSLRKLLISAEEQVATFVSNKLLFLIGSLGLSLITWALMVFEFWLTLRVFGVQLEPTQVIFILTAARIAFLLPVPAGLGTLEAGQVAAMQILGLEPALGLSVSLLIRARDFTLGSLGLLWLGGYKIYPVKSPAGVQTVPISFEERRDKA